MACPSKTFIMRLLHKEGRVDLELLKTRPEILQLSFNRHITELLKYELAYIHDGFLISTDKGHKVGSQVEGGMKRFREQNYKET